MNDENNFGLKNYSLAVNSGFYKKRDMSEEDVPWAQVQAPPPQKKEPIEAYSAGDFRTRNFKSLLLPRTPVNQWWIQVQKCISHQVVPCLKKYSNDNDYYI